MARSAGLRHSRVHPNAPHRPCGRLTRRRQRRARRAVKVPTPLASGLHRIRLTPARIGPVSAGPSKRQRTSAPARC